MNFYVTFSLAKVQRWWGTTEVVPHTDPEHISTEENKLCCCCFRLLVCVWGGSVLFGVVLVGSLVWDFLIYFERLLDAYNSVEKIRLTWRLQLKNNPTDFACSKSPKVKPFY